MDRYYTTAEIAQALHIHRTTVVSWIKSKELIAVKLAGRRLWRIGERDLGRFLRGK